MLTRKPSHVHNEGLEHHRSVSGHLNPSNGTIADENPIAKKNIEAVLRFMPELEQRLHDGHGDNQVAVLRSKKGEPIPRVGHVLLHSMYDAETEARRFIENYDLRQKEVIVVLGFGFAYHIREICKTTPKARIIVIENNLHVMRAALENIDLESILSHVSLILGEQPENLLEHPILRSIKSQDVLTIQHPASVRLNAEYYGKVVNAIEAHRTETKVTVSAVIQTLNEEANIEACLQSLTWVDEIIVCDENSTDRTVDICKSFTKKIYTRESKGYADPNRNFAISKATGDWILVVDADERIPPDLAVEIRKQLPLDPSASAISLPFRTYIFGKLIEHTGWGNEYIPRLFRRGKVNWLPYVHTAPLIDGKILRLTLPEGVAIVHHNYKDVRQFVEKMNRYTEAEAQRFAEETEGQAFQFDTTCVFNGMMKEFFTRYIVNEGFKDGIHGFILSALMGFYYFLTYVKIWEKKNH